jgi:hypothetical protein
MMESEDRGSRFAFQSLAFHSARRLQGKSLHLAYVSPRLTRFNLLLQRHGVIRWQY